MGILFSSLCLDSCPSPCVMPTSSPGHAHLLPWATPCAMPQGESKAVGCNRSWVGCGHLQVLHISTWCKAAVTRPQRCVLTCSQEPLHFLSLLFFSASLKVGESPHIPFSPWSFLARLMKMATSQQIQTSTVFAVSVGISRVCQYSLYWGTLGAACSSHQGLTPPIQRAILPGRDGHPL